MLTVVTHTPSPSLQQCELTYVESSPINIVRAQQQHAHYCRMIETCGARVITLDDNRLLPDSVFVEDPIVVLDEVAILMSMGVASRRREVGALGSFFSKYRVVEQISLPAEIEGGDVLKINRNIYVGESSRTNRRGIEALASIVEPLGYKVIAVRVTGCLHLKTGCTALDEMTILVNSEWVDISPFQGFRLIPTLSNEPFGANVLPINKTICMNDAFPETVRLVRSLGYDVVAADLSEFGKAEAGLTCMSVPFFTTSS